MRPPDPRRGAPVRLTGGARDRAVLPGVVPGSAGASAAIETARPASIELVSALARELAHALNNVLGISQGNLLLLRQAAQDADSAAMLDDALGALGDGVALSSDLELLAGRRPFVATPVDVAAVLRKGAGLLQAAARTRAPLELDIGAGPLAALTDGHFLLLAVRALLRNLPVSSDGGPPRIACEAVYVQAAAAGPVAAAVRSCRPSHIRIALGRGHGGAPPDSGLIGTRGGRFGLGDWFAREVVHASGGDLQDGAPGEPLVILLPCPPRGPAHRPTEFP